MGVTITEDESDKKHRQAKEVGADIVRRHVRDGTSAVQELAAHELDIAETTVLNPDRSKRYHLVSRVKDGEIIARRQGQGYETTKVTKDGPKLVNSAIKDDCQIKGDLVLMETSAENYERRRAVRRQNFERMYGSRNEAAKERINKIAREGGLVGPHKDVVIE